MNSDTFCWSQDNIQNGRRDLATHSTLGVGLLSHQCKYHNDMGVRSISFTLDQPGPCVFPNSTRLVMFRRWSGRSCRPIELYRCQTGTNTPMTIVTSWQGNAFRITDPFICKGNLPVTGGFLSHTGSQSPPQKASNMELWCCLCCKPG